MSYVDPLQSEELVDGRMSEQGSSQVEAEDRAVSTMSEPDVPQYVTSRMFPVEDVRRAYRVAPLNREDIGETEFGPTED